MKKFTIAFLALLAVAALSFTSCETLARAFAEQTGRNIADSLWGKKAMSNEQGEMKN
jgi:hypothetical protein